MNTRAIKADAEGKILGMIYLNNEEELTKELHADGYRIADESAPQPDLDYLTETLQGVILDARYRLNGDRYEMYWVKALCPPILHERISALQSQLASTDYIFAKLAEYSMLPSLTDEQTAEVQKYDIEQLHRERQALRDKITELRNILNTH